MSKRLLKIMVAVLAIAAAAMGPARAQDLVISSATDWDNFAATVNNGTDNFANKTVKLNADITVTSMVGTSANRFAGTFDGGGHTLTVNYNVNENYVAPFRYIEGSAIKYLHVAGAITTSAQFAGGVVGGSYGNSFVNSCWSSVTISSSRSGDGTDGGLVGIAFGNFTLVNCRFDGKLLTTNGTVNCGGFVGWHDNNLTVENCLYAPASTGAGETWIGTSGSSTFARNGITYPSNNYYTTTFGTEQGTAVGSMDNAALQSALGAGWMVSDNKVVPVTSPHALTGNGSWQSPWLIASATDWNNLAYNVNTIGDSYSDQFFKMTADITVSDIVGTGSISFCGSFDGDGHTLTFNKGTSASPYTDEFCTPFRYTCNATFTNLHIAGTIHTQNKCAAFIGRVHGANTLTNCWSSLEINSTVDGDGTHAGFICVADNGGPIILTNCLFDGKMIGVNTVNCGGFIGWTANISGVSSTFVNCLFAPSQMTVSTSGSATFSRGFNTTFTNCYYRQTLGEAQGTAVGSMDNADLAAALGSAWSVSGNQVVPNITSWAGSGTENDPYLIASAGDWDVLSTHTANGTNFSGQYFKLTNDITVSTMVASSNRFSGTFDGDGHTLTVNYNTTGDNAAPFRYTDNATFRNLHVAGSINTTMRYAGGLIAESYGTTNIINCRNSVAIATACTAHQDITCGGFIALVHGVTTFTGCLFDGSITTTDDDNNCGGFAGWVDGGQSATFTDCLFAPSNVTNGMLQMTFARGGGARNFVNCYYTDTYGSGAQGKRASTISAGDGVASLSVSQGEATATYSVSGITAYATGIDFGGNYYVGGGDVLALSLSHEERQGYSFGRYTNTSGNLRDAATNTPTLIMLDADVELGVKYFPGKLTLAANEGGSLELVGATNEKIIDEDFGTYTVGNKLAQSAVAAGSSQWTTWSNAPGGSDDATVQSLNGNTCVQLVTDNDQVLLFGDQTAGMWEYSLDIYVPEGNYGYFNMLHNFDGNNNSWALQCYFNGANDGQNDSYSPGHGTVHAGSSNTADLPCVFNEWMHVKVVIDIDNDVARLYFNGTLQCEWQWSMESFGESVYGGKLAASDIYCASGQFYIDNVTFRQIALPAGFEQDIDGNIYAASGTQFQVKAVPDEDFHLVSLSDGTDTYEPDANGIASVTMPGANLTLTATFAPQPHTVTFAPGTEDVEHWTVTPAEASTTGVVAGTEVTVTYNGTRKVKSVKAVKYVEAPAVSYITVAGLQLIGQDGDSWQTLAANNPDKIELASGQVYRLSDEAILMDGECGGASTNPVSSSTTYNASWADEYHWCE